MSAVVERNFNKHKADYEKITRHIKRLNLSTTQVCHYAYVACYVEHRNIIGYYERYLKRLNRFLKHYEHTMHNDIKNNIKIYIDDAKKNISLYKFNLIDIKERMADSNHL